MPEVSQIKYSLKELTGLMIKDQGIREGLWMIWTRFSFQATNIMSEGEGPSGPGVVSMLLEAGIQQASGPSPLAVDAAEVWKHGAVDRKKTPSRSNRRRTSSVAQVGPGSMSARRK